MILPTQDKEARLTNEEITKAERDGEREYIKTLPPDYDDYRDDKDGWGRRKAGLRAIIEAQITKLEQLGYHKDLPISIEEALNSKDGTYRH